MSNMSYCRFYDTRVDLNDCPEAICQDEKLSVTETSAGQEMFRELLVFLRDYDIIGGYDPEVLEDLFDGLRSGGKV